MIDIAHMAEWELDNQVRILADMKQFDAAAKLITDWVEYDFVGRWADLDRRLEQDDKVQTLEERRIKKSAPMEKAQTIKDRMMAEFGDLGNA